MGLFSKIKAGLQKTKASISDGITSIVNSFTKIDEDFFEENDELLWRELHCYYDSEDDEWLVVGDSFEEFRSKLDPMRSIDHLGEVAEYMMKLSLNKLGEAFLSVDEFVSQNQPYVGTRPKGEFET